MSSGRFLTIKRIVTSDRSSGSSTSVKQDKKKTKTSGRESSSDSSRLVKVLTIQTARNQDEKYLLF